MKRGLTEASTVHEIKVLAFQNAISDGDQVKRIHQLVGLMKDMVGFIEAYIFHNQNSNQWVLHIIWKAADEPYVVSATAADANAIISRLGRSARLVRILP